MEVDRERERCSWTQTEKQEWSQVSEKHIL